MCVSESDLLRQIKMSILLYSTRHSGLPPAERIALTTRWPLPDAVVGRFGVGVVRE